jgi:hypothetical protein
MASRERKRAERRKRKERGGDRRERVAERREAMTARSEQRNREAREVLEPLGDDERPTIVTVGAAVSALVALSVVVGYAIGVEVEGRQPNAAQVAVPAAIFGVMAYGMWRTRYWAVLGFQTVMLLAILWAALSLVGATRWEQAIGNTALIAVAGTLFYLNIKAMARIQMPERYPRDP